MYEGDACHNWCGGRQTGGEGTSGRRETQSIGARCCGGINLGNAYALVKTFMETDFASLHHLGELDLEGIFQLCNDPDAEENLSEGVPLKV